MEFQIAELIIMLICFAGGGAVGYYFAQKYFVENSVTIIEQSLELAKIELEKEIREKYDGIYSNAYKAAMTNFVDAAYKAIMETTIEEKKGEKNESTCSSRHAE